MTSHDISLNDSFFSASSYDRLSSSDSFCSLPSLSKTLNLHFSSVIKKFNVIHINAQSIPSHYSDMISSFDSKHIHAILISESWLKPCMSSVSYNLPDFRLIRNDRRGRGGGVVAIYLRSHIEFTIVSMSNSQETPETEH